jgi:hypothetical protein
MRVGKKDGHKGVSDLAFKPPGSAHEDLSVALFPWDEVKLVVKNRNYRDADGRVITAP